MKSKLRVYSTAEEILYTICLAAWNLCTEYLAQFAALKAIYTEAYIAAAIQEVEDAKKLPQLFQIVADRQEARIALVNATKQVQANWQLLKVYITAAFDADVVKTKLEAAGASLYTKASVRNWSAVRNLIETANTFITNNLDELTANQNMPASFPVTFNEDGISCINASVLFFNLSTQKQMATSARIDANNAIYTRVMEMMKGGQQIFKDDAATKKLFVFDYLVSVYKSEGSASLKGYVLNSLSQPIEGVVITSVDQKYTATTDATGRYRITRIAEGTYRFVVTCPGYAPVEQVITFTAGKATKANFALENLMMKVA